MVDQPPPSSPQQSRGIILDLLDRLLGWLDKPWKALALAGLAILVALGWGGWTSRDTLTDIWRMSSGRPVLKRSELSAMLENLRNETHGDIIGYWSLNLSANSLTFEQGLKAFGEKWEFTPKRLPALPGVARDPVDHTGRLAELMAGQTICREPGIAVDGDLFNRRMQAERISLLCLIPVPPAPNILVGILLIAWIVEPDPSTTEAALALARETAATMVSRWE